MTSSVVNPIDLSPLSHGQAEKGTPLGERLDLVGHVRVRLTVNLGGADIQIGKLFALAPGDVVTLDRPVDAAVDIRLNEKVIARGTLVAAGDNFGVRVTEIRRDT